LPEAHQSECSDGTENKAFEIDLSHKEKLRKRLGVSKLDCFPVLWVKSVNS